jgi:exopolysaccharide production protein ExoQ
MYLDRDRKSPTSPALWLPIVWISIGASRMVTQWLGTTGPMDSPDQYLEGSPLDRLFLTMMLAAALGVLIARGQRCAECLQNNGVILLFFAYCCISAVWSDYPLVAFKRWTKALGNLAMVFVVLTDPNPAEAVKRVFARTGFLMIPLSLLFIKYYPASGRGYDRWLGTTFFTGVSDDKNGLGFNCLVFGLGFMWRFVEAFREKARRYTQLAIHGSMVALVLWLFYLANSATSLACFVLGSTLIVVMTLFRIERPATVHTMFWGMVFVGLFTFLFLDGQTYVLQALGRDSTLTGRTELWQELLRMNQNPLLGTGFESFFLGDRAKALWAKYWWHPNEAHNGYLEVFLNLGWVGIGLLVVLMATGYRNVANAFQRDPRSGSIRFALFAAALVYNVTEAAFKVMHPVWITFLLAIIVIPPLPDLKDKLKGTDVPVKPVDKTGPLLARGLARAPQPRPSDLAPRIGNSRDRPDTYGSSLTRRQSSSNKRNG